MSRTANLRRQHDVIVALAGEIAGENCRLATQADAYRVSVLLARLTGMLRVHFRLEDELLFRYMADSANAEAAAMARKVRDEMAAVTQAYQAFVARWRSSAAILAGLPVYRAQCAALFDALMARVRHENDVLYPLADAIRPHEAKRAA